LKNKNSDLKKNLSESTVGWKYTKRGCIAFVKLLKEVTVDQNLNHNHDVDTILALKQKSNSLKLKANEALCERSTKLLGAK